MSLQRVETDGGQISAECLSGVIGLATLPAAWAGAEPLQIAESLAAALFQAVEPVFVYAALSTGAGQPAVEVAQTGQTETSAALARDLGPRILAWARTHDKEELLLLPYENQDCRTLVLSLGPQAELGVLAAAFSGPDAPNANHRLILRVAASQAGTAVRNAHLLSSLRESEEQARRANSELARNVAQLQQASTEIHDSRRAALNIMEDAVEASRLADQLNTQLRAEVAERQRAEGALRQRTMQFETLLNEAPLGVFLLDADLRIREVNPVAVPIFGDTEQLIGSSFGDVIRALVPPEVISEVVPRFRHTLETGEPYFVPEWVHRRLDCDREDRLEWQINRITLPDGGHGVVCYFRDISRQVRARDAIAESEARFRALVSVLTDVPWTTDPQGRFVTPQQAWSTYTGQSWEQAREFGWRNAIHPEDRQRVFESWQQALRSLQPYETRGRLWHVRTRQYRYFQARAIPLVDAEGKVREWVGTYTDVEEQVRSEDALRRSNEELRLANADLEQFAYSASHDLQEPIRNVAISSEILAKRYEHLLDARGKEHLYFMTSGAKRMEALVKDLLVYTQSANSGGGVTDPTDATAALQKALSNLSTAIRETDAEIRHSALPHVAVSEVQLQQLFQNLIGNAIKYKQDDQPPRILVQAERAGSDWLFSVRDNGIGIAPEYKERIFGIFKRLHGDGKYAGTGIGLAICQKIVERNGGRIWVESKGAGKGSTFYFTFPFGGAV